MPSELLTERRDTTLLLTISGPETRNSLSDQVFAAGIEALGVAESDPAIRCVVLQGAGDNFCAGGDICRLLERIEAGSQDAHAAQRRTVEQLHDWIEVLRVFPKPVIASVEGSAAGAGFSLALGCDLIVAAEDARFILSHGRVGLSPDGGATWQLAQALPRQWLAQMAWLGEPQTAQQLHALGLVNWLTGHGQALEQALAIASRIAETTASNAVASAKELMRAWPPREMAEHLRAERDHVIENLFHPNGREGLAAFLEKRKPRFS